MSPDRASASWEVRPRAGAVVSGTVRVPSSKSLTNRWLNLALLSAGPSRIDEPLESEDTLLFRDALERLGRRVSTDASAWSVAERDATAPDGGPVVSIDCGASGTMMRFLTASLTALPGRFRLDGSPRLRERPIGPLVEALRGLGARIEELAAPGNLPIEIEGATLVGGEVVVDAGESSQYVSALLMALCRARRASYLGVGRLVSQPYVDVTLATLARAKGRVQRRMDSGFDVEPSALALGRVRVEADASSAAYPAAAAVLTGGDIWLEGLDAGSMQGDLGIFEVLESMGARVERGPRWRIRGGRSLHAIDVDLEAMPDQVPTIAALAPFAEGTTRVRGVAHLRLKESDRLAALESMLRCVGVPVAQLSDGLSIPGVWAGVAPPADEVRVDPFGDHRIAMAAALLGLRRPGTVVTHAEVVAKSYPAFWRDLGRISGGRVGGE